MNLPQQLTVSCDFKEFLVCKMPKDVVEVELKIKTKWGKYTLLKDFYTRTEKYRPWERADQCVRIHSKRRTPHHERVEGKRTYIPTGYGKGYPPKIFTNPNYLQNGVENNTSGNSEVEPLATGSKPPSDWDEDLIDLTQTENASNKNNKSKDPLPSDCSDEEHLACQAKAQPQVTCMQPPPGWASWRRKESLPVISKDKSIPPENEVSSKADHEIEVYFESPEDIPKDIVVENPKTISQEEFDKT